jgi:uncharacterized membrane protein
VKPFYNKNDEVGSQIEMYVNSRLMYVVYNIYPCFFIYLFIYLFIDIAAYVDFEVLSRVDASKE